MKNIKVMTKSSVKEFTELSPDAAREYPSSAFRRTEHPWFINPRINIDSTLLSRSSLIILGITVLGLFSLVFSFKSNEPKYWILLPSLLVVCGICVVSWQTSRKGKPLVGAWLLIVSCLIVNTILFFSQNSASFFLYEYIFVSMALLAMATLGVWIAYAIVFWSNAATLIVWLMHGIYISKDAGLFASKIGLDDLILLLAIQLMMVWLADYLVAKLKHANQTAQSQAEQLILALFDVQDSKQRFQALSQAAFEGIILYKEDKVLESNETLAQMLGYTPAELIGKSLGGLIKPLKESNASQHYIEDCPVEAWGVRKDQTLFPVECQSRDFIFQGSPVKVCAIRDITIRKQTEEALKFNQQALLQVRKMESIGRLAGGIAHDFNNLLSVILGECELLLQEMGQESVHSVQIQEIKLAAERSSSLTGQLLAFSRQQKLEPQVINLNKIVGEMKSLLHRLVGKNIQLDIRLEPELADVEIDPGQLEQIVMNLAINARDAMPHGGTLTIKTCNYHLQEEYVGDFRISKGEYVLLEVSDNGTGMDSETQARIFEPFFTTKGEGQGTGLGLAITYGVVKQSDGYILVDSTLGKGTIFSIYLPVIGNLS